MHETEQKEFEGTIRYKLGMSDFLAAQRQLDLRSSLHISNNTLDQLVDLESIFHFLSFDPNDFDDDVLFENFLKTLRSQVLENFDSILNFISSFDDKFNDKDIQVYWFMSVNNLLIYLSENDKEKLLLLLREIRKRFFSKFIIEKINILSMSKILFLYFFQFFHDLESFDDKDQNNTEIANKLIKLKAELNESWREYFGFSDIENTPNEYSKIESLPRVWGNYTFYIEELTNFLKIELKKLGFNDYVIDSILFTYINLGPKEYANEYDFLHFKNPVRKITQTSHIRDSLHRLFDVKNKYGSEVINNLHGSFGITQFMHLSDDQIERQMQLVAAKVWVVVARSYDHFSKSVSRVKKLEEQLRFIGYPNTIVQFEIDKSAKSIKNFHNQAENMGKPDLIIFVGHGSIEMLELESGYGMIKSSMIGEREKQLKRLMKSISNSTTELVLLACSAHGIAKRLASLGFSLTYAPSEKINNEVIELESENNTIKVKDITFLLEEDEVETRSFTSKV